MHINFYLFRSWMFGFCLFWVLPMLLLCSSFDSVGWEGSLGTEVRRPQAELDDIRQKFNELLNMPALMEPDFLEKLQKLWIDANVLEAEAYVERTDDIAQESLAIEALIAAAKNGYDAFIRSAMRRYEAPAVPEFMEGEEAAEMRVKNDVDDWQNFVVGFTRTSLPFNKKVLEGLVDAYNSLENGGQYLIKMVDAKGFSDLKKPIDSMLDYLSGVRPRIVEAIESLTSKGSSTRLDTDMVAEILNQPFEIDASSADEESDVDSDEEEGEDSDSEEEFDLDDLPSDAHKRIDNLIIDSFINNPASDLESIFKDVVRNGQLLWEHREILEGSPKPVREIATEFFSIYAWKSKVLSDPAFAKKLWFAIYGSSDGFPGFELDRSMRKEMEEAEKRNVESAKKVKVFVDKIDKIRFKQQLLFETRFDWRHPKEWRAEASNVMKELEDLVRAILDFGKSYRSDAYLLATRLLEILLDQQLRLISRLDELVDEINEDTSGLTEIELMIYVGELERMMPFIGVRYEGIGKRFYPILEENKIARLKELHERLRELLDLAKKTLANEDEE